MQNCHKWEWCRGIRATVAMVVVGLLFSLSIALAVRAQNQAAPAEIRQLELNKPIERELKGSEAHTYEITLAANQYLNVMVEQKGIDVVVQVIAPDGKPIMEVDSPNGDKGPEPVQFISVSAGRYKLKVSSLEKDAPAGHYEIHLKTLRVAYDEDRALLEKERALLEAKNLDNEARGLSRAGKYDLALPLAERALAIREKVLGTNHASTADSLNNLALLYENKSDYGKAEPLYLRALAISENILGAEHPDTATTLNNLGALYDAKGEFAKAEFFYLRALTIREKVLGKEQPDTALSLNNLATLYGANGDYAKAEPLYLSALAIREKVLDAEHPDIAQSLNNLAQLYDAKGDYAKAEPRFVRALAIFEKVLGKEHPNVAVLLNNLADLYRKTGEYAKAELSYLSAVSILEKTLGKEHRLTATSLNNLAVLYRNKGDYEKAETIYLRVLAIREKVLGAEHPDTAQSLNNLATLYDSKGEYGRAEPLLVRALAIYEKAFGVAHPLAAKALNNLAGMYQVTGNLKPAIVLRNRCNEVVENDFIRNLASGSERQRLLYLNRTAHYLDLTLSLHSQAAPNDLPARQMALRMLLQRKGRALDATTDAIAALRRRASADDQKLLDQLTLARSQLSNATLKGAGKDGIAKHQANLKSLTEQVENLEAELSRRSAEFRAQAVPVTLEAIQPVVPNEAALIEFASFYPYEAKANKYGERRYVAYLLTTSGNIQWADLGEAAKIDKAVKEFRAVLHQKPDGRLSNLKGEVMPKARALDELVMRPLRPLLGDKKRLLISPDGSLNLIPFDALIDEKNHYLVESYSISYLTSGRDLLRLQAVKPNNKTAIVIADPDFDNGATSVKTTTADSRIAQRVDNPQNDKERLAQRVETRPGPKLGDVQLQPFERLPGSAKEGAKLKKLIPDATVLTAAEATETALKRAASPSILHISTHGGFLEAEPKPEPNAQRGLLIRSDDSDEPLLNMKVEDPLLRSGLFFAGANRGRSGNDDGVLTALEAKDLDLYGTKLVVLSACDTGVGEVKNGDGVYGLRRALVLAGSETQVMSLWSVSDEGTRELMIDYYKRLLKGEGRGDALRQVRLQMLASEKRKHPYYWASFIQSGEWANLDGKR